MSTMVSLDDFVTRLARRVGLLSGIGIATLIGAILIACTFSYYRLAVERAFSTHIESFSFWMQVNDRYQIQRALADIVDTQNLAGAIVLDNQGNIIAQKGDVINSLLSSNRSVAPTLAGFLVRSQFQLHESASFPRQIGMIVIGLTIPYIYVFGCLVGSALLIVLSICLTKRSFLRISERMTVPVRRLAESVARAKTLEDLRAIDRDTVEFSELRLLVDKIADMSERLVLAEKSKEIFNLGRQVAHDIRSPLSALRMAVDSAKELDGNRRELILKVADRIDRIAENLLDNSRNKVTAKAFDLGPACKQIILEKKTSISQDVKLDLDIQDSAKFHLALGNRDEFQRLLSNLINNSIEALKECGNVRVTIKSGNFATVEIADDGIGISTELLNDLRKGICVSSKANGNGLGLTHARNTLHSWGGEMHIDSKPGSGTTIALNIPWAPGEQ